MFSTASRRERQFPHGTSPPSCWPARHQPSANNASPLCCAGEDSFVLGVRPHAIALWSVARWLSTNTNIGWAQILSGLDVKMCINERFQYYLRASREECFYLYISNMTKCCWIFIFTTNLACIKHKRLTGWA